MRKMLSALFILCIFSVVSFATEFSDDLMNRVNELKGSTKTKSEERLQKPKVEDNPRLQLPDNSEMKKRAETVATEDIPNLMKEVEKYRIKIAKDTVGIENGEICSEKDGESCWDDREDMNNLHLYVFISSSMPEETLKRYAADMKKLPNGIMVITGAVGGVQNIMPTINLLARVSCGKNVSELLKADMQCAMSRTDINPYLFRAFDVKAVPAIIYSEIPYQQIMQDITLGRQINENAYLKLSGDVNLDYALNRFENEGISKAKAMRKQLKAGGFHEAR
jgi:type-F conjugative transfer system pilin assembly protein TrbC